MGSKLFNMFAPNDKRNDDGYRFSMVGRFYYSLKLMLLCAVALLMVRFIWKLYTRSGIFITLSFVTLSSIIYTVLLLLIVYTIATMVCMFSPKANSYLKIF